MIEAMKPAPESALYQPITRPRNVATTLPIIPRTVVKIKPCGLFGPGISHLATSPATKPMITATISCIMSFAPAFCPAYPAFCPAYSTFEQRQHPLMGRAIVELDDDVRRLWWTRTEQTPGQRQGRHQIEPGDPLNIVLGGKILQPADGAVPRAHMIDPDHPRVFFTQAINHSPQHSEITLFQRRIFWYTIEWH